MSINLTSLKCPTCGGNFSVDPNMDTAFCPYCRSQIKITNENEHIYRKVDEAKIKEAETAKILGLKEIEHLEKKDMFKYALIGVAIVAVLIILLFGSKDATDSVLIVAMFATMFGFIAYMNKKKNRPLSENEIQIGVNLMQWKGKPYADIVAKYEGAGFTNVSAVPLNDLNSLTMFKNEKVAAVSINGREEFEPDDIFPKDAVVMISYHTKDPNSLL